MRISVNNIIVKIVIALAIILTSVCPAQAQSSIDSVMAGVDLHKWATNIENKTKNLRLKLIARSYKALDRLQRQEEKLYRKMLAGKDSVQAKAMLIDIKVKYSAFRDKLNNPTSGSVKSYLPQLDTFSTAFKFLEQEGIGGNVKNALSQTQSLQQKFQQAEEVKKFICERRRQLKEQLEKLGLSKQLKQISKELYYYSARVTEYKALLKDLKKAERKAIELLSKTIAFKSFMHRHSQLASLFRLPDDDPADMTSLSGLQTRVQVNALIQQQLSPGDAAALQQFRQNLHEAQSQLHQLRNKITQSGGGSSEDILPEGFRPNNQRTKSFWQRLEFGANIQTQRSNRFWPVTSDLGLSIGYKINDRSVIGIGGSYKVGLGNGFRNMKPSSEGSSFRSFIDWNLKNSFWISGGFEMNYRSAFNNVDQLRDMDAWQQSGLIGMSKITSVRNKFLKKTKLQLLWDFLSYRQPPKTQPLVFRIGYNF